MAELIAQHADLFMAFMAAYVAWAVHTLGKAMRRNNEQHEQTRREIQRMAALEPGEASRLQRELDAVQYCMTCGGTITSHIGDCAESPVFKNRIEQLYEEGYTRQCATQIATWERDHNNGYPAGESPIEKVMRDVEAKGGWATGRDGANAPKPRKLKLGED